MAQGFEELVGYIERLSHLYSRDLSEGLDRLMALLPGRDSQKSVEPFGLDLLPLDNLIEKPAKHDAAYLVDKEPPFPGRGIEGAEWIEVQVQELKTKRFHIEVTVPAQLSRMESLAWLKDYLNRKLEHYLLPNSSDDSLRLKEFLVESVAVRDIGWGMPTLAYLVVNGAGEIDIKRVRAKNVIEARATR